MVMQNPYYLVIYEDPLNKHQIISKWWNTFEEAYAYAAEVGYADAIYRYSGTNIIERYPIHAILLGSTKGLGMYTIREILKAHGIPITDEPYEPVPDETHEHI